MDAEEIEDEVIKLFDSLVEPLSNEDYRDLCENLAANFQSRYDAVCEEIGDE